MLSKLKSLLAYHVQAIIQSLNLLCRKPLASIMTSLVIAIALALPAFFWVFTDNLNQLTQSWQQGGHISLYLKTSLKADAQLQLLKKVQNIQGVGQASIKSSTQGLAELTQQEGMHDIMRYLPENPLPALIEVTPALTIDSPAKLKSLAHQLALPGVDEVKLDMEWVSRLHAILQVASKASHALMALLALAVVLIIGTTLRLAIHHRHEEIQVLKLIGASDLFILRPFLYSGVWYGLSGALLAILMVNIFILGLGIVMNHLAVVYQMHYPLTGLSIRQILPLILFAIILGGLAAHLSVKRQLMSIEPYK